MTVRAQSWLVWLAAAVVTISLSRHPLYVLLALGAVRIVGITCRSQERLFRVSLWRIGVVIVLFAALFNVLFVHIGVTVIARLPGSWWLIGGDLTVEALVYGAVNGLVLVALLAAFVTFNEIVPVHELVRLTPRAFRDLGVVVLVAVTYVPETQQHWQRIREAQAIRGHTLRGVRDWRPLIIPLLVGGLERAIGLAEAMVSRGYGTVEDETLQTRLRLLLLVTLFLTILGWGLTLWLGAPGWGVMALGLGVMGFVLWRLGRTVQVTVYRPKPVTIADVLILIASTALLIIVILWRDQIAYSPYPRLDIPSFNLWLGLALLLLLVPALVTMIEEHRDRV
ncbi:MAG: energy-coupling factor transporter transmembrane protein EcfT [Anaerolineae bacterium]|nr:energy-coupling factor transporter transmembrane protein EcfT [Anaerolineae bacterium]MCO5199083.1 energy-coupling factor transporter transmembrane protein EcfT [Anaerolineae bacterium]